MYVFIRDKQVVCIEDITQVALIEGQIGSLNGDKQVAFLGDRPVALIEG